MISTRGREALPVVHGPGLGRRRSPVLVGRRAGSRTCPRARRGLFWERRLDLERVNPSRRSLAFRRSTSRCCHPARLPPIRGGQRDLARTSLVRPTARCRGSDCRTWRCDGTALPGYRCLERATCAQVVADPLALGAELAPAATWAGHVHGRAVERLFSPLGPWGYLARELAPQMGGTCAARLERHGSRASRTEFRGSRVLARGRRKVGIRTGHGLLAVIGLRRRFPPLRRSRSASALVPELVDSSGRRPEG